MAGSRRTKLFVVVLTLAVSVAWMTASYPAEQQDKREAGQAAWQQVYSVLTHPRCINCHTATNYPQQGDERRRHFANVDRGSEDCRPASAVPRLLSV